MFHVMFKGRLAMQYQLFVNGNLVSSDHSISIREQEARNATKEEMEAVLQKVNLLGFLQTQNGLQTELLEKAGNLSGGQCQRVAIARAIVGKPQLLLADEPTGALDSASGAAVMELFQQLHDSGSTIIMITHDQGIAQHAHTIMNIRDGVLSGGAFHE